MLFESVLRRAASRRSTVAAALLACVATTGAVVGGTPSSGTAAPVFEADLDPIPRLEAEATGFVVQLGPEQRLLGPSNHIDTPFFSERNSAGKLVGILGNNNTYRWDTKENTKLTNERKILPKGDAGSFDYCGAWISGSIYKNPSDNQHWVAWYHSEEAHRNDGTVCNYSSDRTTWRMAFAESKDGGKTWKKTNYQANPRWADPCGGLLQPPCPPANNVVITADTQLAGDVTTDDTGNGRIIQMGEFLYMYYMSSSRGHANKMVHVARASTASMGRPGSWKKWFCSGPDTCGFTEEGIGGRSTPISTLPGRARFITWNSYLQRFIGLNATGREGFQLYVSQEGTRSFETSTEWDGMTSIYPPVSSLDDELVDKWGTRGPKVKQLYAYPSMLGENGDSQDTGQDFYIYYMKLFPGDPFGERHLFRRKVSLVKESTGLSRVALTTYKRRSDGRRRTSTEAPEIKAFRKNANVGYLLSVSRPGWSQVFECKGRKGDVFLSRENCAGRPSVRRVGWISPQRLSVTSVKVYNCFNKRLRNHFSSTSRRCDGAKRIGVLGYGLGSLR